MSVTANSSDHQANQVNHSIDKMNIRIMGILTNKTARLAVIALAIIYLGALPAAAAPLTKQTFTAMIEQHCTRCHDADEKKGKLDLDAIFTQDISKHTLTWEKVLGKINARQMPPVGKRRPTETGYKSLTDYLVGKLDVAAAANPPPPPQSTIFCRHPGRSEVRVG